MTAEHPVVIGQRSPASLRRRDYVADQHDMVTAPYGLADAHGEPCMDIQQARGAAVQRPVDPGEPVFAMGSEPCREMFLV
jgi:hypothetical protein